MKAWWPILCRKESSSSLSQSEDSDGSKRLRCCGEDSDSSSTSTGSDDSSWCALSVCQDAKFHLVPKNGWHPFVKRMRCSAVNTIKWFGEGPVPQAPDDCWLLPTSDAMALRIAQQQVSLAAAGWKVLTCAPQTVNTLSNKASMAHHAKELGLLAHLPKHWDSPEEAEFPCILKAAVGEHGKNVFIVHSPKEVYEVTTEGFGSTWLLQELVSGSLESCVSLLVDRGEILDAICTEYEYDKEEYVWPHVGEVNRWSHCNIPADHLDTMHAFLVDYSGICNFNYKVRPSGSMCIFEVNTRVGADLACDVPRKRARALFEKLDSLTPSRTSA